MKNNIKTWFFMKKGFNLNSLILFKIIYMWEFKPNAIKLKPDTLLKLKNIELETWWVSLSTYDDKINHLIWFYNKYKDKKL